jgi:hypothetical protein
MSLADKLKSAGVKLNSARKEPLWKGPEVEGVTFSLLSRFLCCRERFRVVVVQGLKPDGGFNHRIEYGQMWHVCEEFTQQGQAWEGALAAYCRNLTQTYRDQQEQVNHWYRVCMAQFSVYLDYWRDDPDTQTRQVLLPEYVFDVPYYLPSRREVRLRGKFDSVDLIGKGREKGLYLQENKTKGDVNVLQIQRQLKFDLQTMLYAVALSEHIKRGVGGLHDTPWNGQPLKGVRYNVVKRPLSGGKGTIVRHKPSKSNPAGESADEFYGRLQGIITETPGEFFWRWKSDITPADVERFKVRCLNPLLEQLCDWWDWITQPGDDILNCCGPHWQHPFGVYNTLDEGGSTDLDEYLETGSEVGLKRVDNLFPELQ